MIQPLLWRHSYLQFQLLNIFVVVGVFFNKNHNQLFFVDFESQIQTQIFPVFVDLILRYNFLFLIFSKISLLKLVMIFQYINGIKYSIFLYNIIERGKLYNRLSVTRELPPRGFPPNIFL